MTFKSDGFSHLVVRTPPQRRHADRVHPGRPGALRADDPAARSPPPRTEISGSFTQSSADRAGQLAEVRRAAAAFDRAESVKVSAELGLEYLQAGLIAGGIGLLLVIIYCLIYYRLLGVITILSLVLSFGLVYAVMVLLGRWIGYSLDMAGVAGLIIAIGITADSFVIYFERHQGRGPGGPNVPVGGATRLAAGQAHHPVRRRRVLPVGGRSCTCWPSAR